jgi:hypothetical protein
VGGQGEADNSGGTSTVPVIGDGTWKGRRWGASVFGGGRGRRRGDSIVSEADDTSKSGAATGEVKGGD